MAEFKNEWFGGRNSDTDPAKLPPNQYISANNVELTGEGAFASLRNISGTTLAQQLSTSATFKILQAIPNKYLISGELVDCITVFSVDSTTFKIQAYDCENDTTYDLYTETVPGDYTTTVKDIDAKTHPENGTDFVYYTDNYLEIRNLKCEIPDPYSPNFLTAYDISLLRKGSVGTITSAVGTTGTLLSGTYQFCYRMADPTNKRFTKWSTPTNPVHVYSIANSTTPVYSGIGLITNRKVTLTITPSEEETDNFDYLQVAVIPNVGPTYPIAADLLEIEAIAGTSLALDYKSNSKIGTVPIEDIVVDLAQIKKAKTLNIKDNRLFAGNVTYADLEFDNGEPAITSGTVITQADASVDSFSSDDFASNYRGHWRGEVYRYGVVYEDEYGNKSAVKNLDLNSTLIPTNTISSGLTDMKFPDRTDADYTLFNSSGQIQSLGLRLTGLNNHPSWARKLEIVRVDRKGQFKNILFQSPIIPMTSVYGIGALEDYPNVVTYSSATDSEKTYEDATPMTSGHTLVPKNLFWPDLRSIARQGGTTGSGTTKKISGEAVLQRVGSAVGYEYSMIFPDESIYNPANGYKYSGAEKLDIIDYALLKCTVTASNPTKTVTVVSGDDVNTNVTGTFHATADNQYYFNNGHAKSAISTTDRAITDYEFFDNLGTTDSVAGKAVMDYEALQTGGINLGFKPNIQRSAVVKIAGSVIPDAASSSKVFSAATWNNYSAGGALSSASATLVYEASDNNKYINEYPTFSSGSSYTNVVAIVNVKLGLGDDRYGEATDLQEYISTGCKYTFTADEVATLEGGGDVVLGNLDVWGGDCVVSAHTFKVCDSTYSVANQNKHTGSAQSTDDLISKWNSVLYKNINEDCFLSIPVAVENAAQYIQVVLESEYNGAVREQDFLEGSSASIPVMTGQVATARTPLTYKYNLNLNKQNSQKIYVPDPQFSFKQSEFGARVHWTDLKIYNSDQQGFDIFRVADFFDIEEKYRPITKLALAGDNLYSIHEQGVIRLLTGEKQVEQADGGILSVTSGQVIGGKVVVDSERGSQHLRGIVETGGVVYIPDNRNKTVYALSGQQLVPITKDNETIFRSFFSTIKTSLIGVYDPVRKQYWIADGTDCHVFDERGFWVSNYVLNLKGAASTNQKLYVMGLNGTDTSIYSYYTGTPGTICGVSVDSDVTYAVNPVPDFSKTFDNVMVNASERLSSIDFVVDYESSIGNQTATASLDVESYENNFRVKNPRDSNSARLRGMYLQCTITWKTTQSALRAAWTKYRMSARSPW